MAIDAPLSVRAADESRRQAGREAAIQYMLAKADVRRDTRIEEARAASAARPRVAERGSEGAPRPKAPGTGLMVDILT